MNKNNVYAFSNVDVSNHVESKAGLAYLNWAFVSDVLHRQDPDTQFIVHQYKPFSFKLFRYLDGHVPFNLDPNTEYASVAVTLEFKGHKLTEFLPCYDYRGRAVRLPNSLLVNKTIKRCEVKAAAELTGLGISLYINGTTRGVDNDAKNIANNANTTDDAVGANKDVNQNNNVRSRNTSTGASRGATVGQIKYIKYLIYRLSSQYGSTYGEVVKEICQNHNLRSISTANLNKYQASNLIKEMQIMLPGSSRANQSATTNTTKRPIDNPNTDNRDIKRNATKQPTNGRVANGNLPF